MILAIPCPGHYFRLPLNACARSLASALWRIVRQAGAHTRSLSPPPPGEAAARALPIRVRTRRLLHPFVHSEFTVSQLPVHLHRSADPDDDGRLRVANPSALLPFFSTPPSSTSATSTTSCCWSCYYYFYYYYYYCCCYCCCCCSAALCPLTPPFGGRSADWELSVVCRGPASPRRWWGSFHDPSRLVSTLQDRDATRRAASQCQSPHESGQDLTGQTDASQKRRSEVRFGSTRVSRGLLWPML